MSLYEGSRTKVTVGSGTSDEFEVRVGVHQGSVLSPLIFAIVVDVATEHARKGLLNKILYADDLVLMSESLEDLWGRFQRGRRALEGKELKVNVGKTKMMVSGTKGEIRYYAMKVLCDEVETVKGFCYLGDRLNASGGCKTAVTSRVRIG